MKERAYLAVMTGAAIGGTGGVIIKYFTIPVTSIAWMRMAVPCILLAILIQYRGISFFRGNYKTMLGGSLLNALRMYLFLVAFIYTSIGNAIIMFYTWPIFATLLGATILKEKISTRQILLLGLAFVGIILAYSNQTFSFEDQDFIGMIAAIGSAFVYALTVIVFKFEADNYSRNEIVFYQNLLGAFIFLPFFIFNEPLPTSFDIGLGVFYGVLIGTIAFSLFFFGLKNLPASRVSMLTYTEVISALLLSYFWFGDVLSWNMVIGGTCIILSTLLLRMGD